MIISLVVLLLIAFSGFALTYLFADDEPFLWRLSAGNIIGAAIFGLVGFLIASLFGLYPATVLIALLISILPLALFTKKDIKKKFGRDWGKAKGKMQGANFKKILRFGYYLFFFVLFWFFFERVMFETSRGIFTGGSQNLGDLPFHLGAIFGFSEGQNFPPQNPSFADARFSYPFIADFLSATLVKIGVDVKNAMFALNISWAFSLLVILERFVFKFTNNRLAGKIAPVLLFFSGGLGFLWFAKDYLYGANSFFDFVRHLPRDYTISEAGFRWGNSLTTLFITQRSLLFGMPLMLIVLQKIWEIFSEKKESDASATNFSAFSHFPFSIFFVGLLAGMLPLIHAHSLMVLFVVSAFLFALSFEKWRMWIAFGIGVAVVAVPELFFAMQGSATKTTEFIGWHFGWNMPNEYFSNVSTKNLSSSETVELLRRIISNFYLFWFKNTGFFIAILFLGILLTQRRKDAQREDIDAKKQNTKGKNETDGQLPNAHYQLLFYLPFLFLFIVSNTMKLAPWEWDNIKVLIYWFVGSLPFAALALAWIYNRGKIFRVVAVCVIVGLTAAGAIDVWRVVSKQINYDVFSPDAIKIAEQIKRKTEPNALFLDAPTYNTAVVLSGRRSLMRYPGHLSSHGIEYGPREADLKRIYQGSATADILLKKYNIEYVLLSPEIRAYAEDAGNGFELNEKYFQKFQPIAENGEYKIYKVK
jgi:hypothetical protein